MAQLKRIINEAQYASAIGFEEVFKFYRKANDYDIDEFENWMKLGKKHKAWNVLKRVLRIAWNL